MNRYQRPADRPTTCNALFRCLADGRNRLILRTLRARSSVDRSTLVSVLVDEFYRPRSSSDPPTKARVALHHDLLPRLAEANLVEYDEGTVTATDHPVLESISGSDLLESDSSVDEHALDGLFEFLADDRRRLVWTLCLRRGSISVETLARVVGALEHGGGTDAEFRARVQRIQVSLVHDHLPRLESVGLISRSDDGWLEVDPEVGIDPSTVVTVDPVDAHLFG